MKKIVNRATLLLCVGLIGCANVPRQHPAMPVLIEVAAWGGTATVAPIHAQRITRITLHHQGETAATSAEVAAYLRRLQLWSRMTKRWADIPYHYVIAPDGRIYTARPLSMAGDTNTEYAPEGHALLMLMGNFEDTEPTDAQLQSAVALTAALVVQHGLGINAIASHKDFSAQTLCPGKNLYRHLQSGEFQRAVVQLLQPG